MAAAAYTTDLTTINAADATTNWTNIGTGAVVAETDFFVQGTVCISKPGWTGDATRGMIYNNGSGVTITTPNVYLAWVYFWGPGALESEANGGLQLIIGSSPTAYKQWFVKGSDTILPFDGWVCIPIDPSLTADLTTGAPAVTLQYFGALARIKAGSAISKGNPFGIDAIRAGRAILQIVSGDLANGYATFTGAEAIANSTANRWGLFQQISGGYLYQGLLLLGTASTAVDFRDSNRVIVIANTKKVAMTFNTIEVRNVSSRVEWTNISISALGTVSRGNFLVTDNATVVLTGCTFADMGTFTFKSLTTANGTTFRRCQLVTQAGSSIVSCVFDNTADATRALLSDNPAQVQSNRFVSGGTKHAIEITTPGTYSFSGNTFVGYAATDGSTGNETIYNNSGGAVTLNIVGGGSTPSIRNGVGASTTVNSNVSVTLTGLKNPSEVRVFTSGTTTAVAGQENVTTGQFTFGVASGALVDIAILALGYQNMRLLSYSTTSDATVPISQQVDRQYQNL